MKKVFLFLFWRRGNQQINWHWGPWSFIISTLKNSLALCFRPSCLSPGLSLFLKWSWINCFLTLTFSGIGALTVGSEESQNMILTNITPVRKRKCTWKEKHLKQLKILWEKFYSITLLLKINRKLLVLHFALGVLVERCFTDCHHGAKCQCAVYSRPLKNTGLNCLSPLVHRLFSLNALCCTTLFKVGWICGYRTADMIALGFEGNVYWGPSLSCKQILSHTDNATYLCIVQWLTSYAQKEHEIVNPYTYYCSHNQAYLF